MSFFDASHKFKFIFNLFMEQFISLVQRSVPFFQWRSNDVKEPKLGPARSHAHDGLTFPFSPVYQSV